ncbi:MAG TPA: cupin domain-containing protein [Streptosporangiaceae bacterium]|nr:cupin domain-containing protein [Streptosporangiaceae bacterium]
MEPRLIVTGFGPDGTSTVLHDAAAAPVTVRALPGQDLYLLWGTADGGATVGTQPQEPVQLPFFPGPGGTRLLMVRFPPRSATAVAAGDPGDIAAEAAAELPGLMDTFESDDSGMHATDTLDYGICLEGELWLELDGGKEVRLTPGTCVVQQGTRHAWHNYGDAPALMCFVDIGARREAAGRPAGAP